MRSKNSTILIPGFKAGCWREGWQRGKGRKINTEKKGTQREIDAQSGERWALLG